ncbi:uncharacterized protein LOC107039211 [Diachasma alloeum]|uniref:uncharacterized protein LOC107039211 n=1 Tax=Diachasma alloeum TaxID=454923 RepID=UPI0007382EE6|nr:uncharacterized protein LOC107039211 [Diachasma alloeum]
MWLLRFSNPPILCLLICIGLGVTLQEEWNESLDAAEDSSADFFDFPLSKLLKQMKQIEAEREEEVEEIPESIRKKVPKPSAIEPEAEMLPAHYTGVKPPGVDHMELVITDAKMENSDGDVYMIAVKNKKNPQVKKGTDKIHKKHFRMIKKKKSGDNPEGSEHSKQRRNMKTVRNFVYEGVFEREGNSEGGEDQRSQEERRRDGKL